MVPKNGGKISPPRNFAGRGAFFSSNKFCAALKTKELELAQYLQV